MIWNRIFNKKGSTLLLVMLALFILMSLGSYLILFLTSEIRINKATEQKIQARYRAEAGVEHGMLSTGNVGLTTEMDPDNSSQKLYDYSVAVVGTTTTVIARGYINNAATVRIQCEIVGGSITKWLESKP